jgi:hypothetical protein
MNKQGMADKPKIRTITKAYIIKKVDRQQLDDYQRQHEIGLLRILILKQPEKAQEILDEMKAKAA